MRIKRMKTMLAGAAAGAILLIGIGATAAPLKAKVMKASGTVEAQVTNGAWAKVAQGASLAEGTKVRTGPNSEAFLRWGDGNTVKISALSQIELTKMQLEGDKAESRIGLTNGKVFSKVGKLNGPGSKFEVKTPLAVAGVRGTGFEAGYVPGQPAVFSVVEGTISVEAGGESVDVASGMMSSVTEGTPPSEPEQIPPAQLETLQQDNTSAGEVSSAEEPATGSSATQEKEGQGEAAAGEPAAEEPAAEAEQASDVVDQNLETADQSDQIDTAIEDASRAVGNLEIIIH